jgi:hypothetical protein
MIELNVRVFSCPVVWHCTCLGVPSRRLTPASPWTGPLTCLVPPFLFSGKESGNIKHHPRRSIMNVPTQEHLNIHHITEASTPEDAFLQPPPAIAPIDMVNCILDRTISIIECLDLSLDNEDREMSRNTISNTLWQIQGNLKQVKAVAVTWHEGEIRSRREGVTGTPVSLCCPTGGEQKVS